jgi:hypothetical protein
VVVLSPTSPITQARYWSQWGGTDAAVRFVALAPPGEELPGGWVSARGGVSAEAEDAWGHPRLAVVVYQLLAFALETFPGADMFYLVSGDSIPVTSREVLLDEPPRTTFGLDISNPEDVVAFDAPRFASLCAALTHNSLGWEEYKLLSASHSTWFAMTSVDLASVLRVFPRLAPRLGAIFMQNLLHPDARKFLPPDESWWLMIYLCIDPGVRGATHARVRALERATMIEARGANVSYSPYTFATDRQEHLVWMGSYGSRRQHARDMWLNLDAFILFSQVQLGGAAPSLFARKVGSGAGPSIFWIDSGMASGLSWLRERGQRNTFTSLQAQSEREWIREATRAGFPETGPLVTMLRACRWSLAEEGDVDADFRGLQRRGVRLRASLSADLARTFGIHGGGAERARRRRAASSVLRSASREHGLPSSVTLGALEEHGTLRQLESLRRCPRVGVGPGARRGRGRQVQQ